MTRLERLEVMRASARRNREDRDLEIEIAIEAEIRAREARTARCPHGSGPARRCSQCQHVATRRIPPGVGGTRTDDWDRRPPGAARRTHDRELLSVNDIEARGVPRAEVRAAVAAKELRPQSRQRGTIFFAPRAVEEWLARRGQPSPAPCDGEAS